MPRLSSPPRCARATNERDADDRRDLGPVQRLARLARAEHVPPAVVRDPRRADAALHRALPRPAECLPRHVRVDIRRQHRCPDGPRGGRPDDRRDHAWDRPLGRRRHRRLERTRRHAHEGQPPQHGRLVARDPRSRRDASAPSTGSSSPTAGSSRSLSPWQRSRSCRGLRSGFSRSRAASFHPPTRTRSRTRKDRGAFSSLHSWQSPGSPCDA